MKKLTALRNHLLASVPGLANDPDRLLTFVQDGSIQFHRGQHLSHQYQVPAQIVLTDYSGELDAVIIPLLQWLSHYQPDLDPDEAVRFEAEILANDRWDLALSVTLTERVVARVDCEAGSIKSDHRMPEFPIEHCPGTDWQLYTQGPHDDAYQLTSEWQSP
ncbi:P2 phage tail completion protein R (GpR) [Modicisalibacter ilicicola DSM 19980]|uniref:p2 phage tail completion protein R (GpR) n=1 Tax=Modicisalibacter ilicicola DSM 19980 TaxID=1121942 RepID=A0A1M4Y417_9GAMM|nr:phage tail protein [Halomonas ilicicola]SHF00455.1 P2 phage tail completion protein R (GpR) [Halomonas ilicicola DSM 19980]